MHRKLLKTILLLTILILSAVSIQGQEAGAESLNDSLYPQLGNGGYDALHYSIDLSFDPDANFLSGSTTMEAIATEELSRFSLDFSGMEVGSVTVNEVEADFIRDHTKLQISPADTISLDETFMVTVHYSGTPEAINDPGVPFVRLGWQEWSPGYYASVSEPSGAMNWFPSNNHPLDKATFTIAITVPQPQLAVANGVLRETIEHDNASRTFVWDMNDLMASYLAIVAVGDFVEVRDDSGDVPIRNYFPANTPQTVIDSYDVTPAMMDYLTDLLGDYPFEVYGIVAVPGFPAALETQTLSIFGSNSPGEDTIMHELMHQWFGDSVTVADWSDIWLHEGFALYFEALWAEQISGEAGYSEYITGFTQYASSAELTAPGDIAIEDLFGATVYVRGALVLHALRETVGDEDFFEILRTFYENHAYSVATTEDFIAVAESVSGQELDDLFEAWLFSDTLPDTDG